MAPVDHPTNTPADQSAWDPNASEISRFLAMDMMALAREVARSGKEIVHLEIGQTSFPAPERVRACLKAMGDTGGPGYTEALGLPRLREAIANHYTAQYGVSVDPERILITTGSSGAFVLTFLLLFAPGERVGLPLPWYPAYPNILKALGRKPVPLAPQDQQHFKLTPDDIPDTGIQHLIVTGPGNPTGTSYTAKEIKALAERLKTVSSAPRPMLISDEIYHGITYDEPAQTAVDIDENIIVINSFSKFFAIPGLRLGWTILPPDLIKPAEALLQNLFISPPGLAQIAGLEALQSLEELNGYVREYARSRSLFLEELPGLGLGEMPHPAGAFYLYPKLPADWPAAPVLAERLLREAGLAVTPGNDFDPFQGHRRIRMSYACEPTIAEQAIDRLRGWVKEHR